MGVIKLLRHVCRGMSILPVETSGYIVSRGTFCAIYLLTSFGLLPEGKCVAPYLVHITNRRRGYTDYTTRISEHATPPARHPLPTPT